MTEIINSEQSLSEFGMSAIDVEITDEDTLYRNNNADTQDTNMLESASHNAKCSKCLGLFASQCGEILCSTCVALSVDYSSSDVASSKENIHDFLLKLVSKKDEGHIDFSPRIRQIRTHLTKVVVRQTAQNS